MRNRDFGGHADLSQGSLGSIAKFSEDVFSEWWISIPASGFQGQFFKEDKRSGPNVHDSAHEESKKFSLRFHAEGSSLSANRGPENLLIPSRIKSPTSHS